MSKSGSPGAYAARLSLLQSAGKFIAFTRGQLARRPGDRVAQSGGKSSVVDARMANERFERENVNKCVVTPEKKLGSEYCG